MSEDYRRCSKAYTPECEGCDGQEDSKENCPSWETARTINALIRVLKAHVEASNKLK